MAPADLQKIVGPSACLLADASSVALNLDNCDVKRPFVDAALRDPRTYGIFLKELADRGMLEFKSGKHKSLLGIFCVAKKSGKLRLIFDTRLCNCYFHNPPHVELPTATAISAIEGRRGDQMYFSCGDISDYFYHIESPPHVRNLLSLPHIQGRFLDEELRLRLGVGPGETLTPCLTVIPMGWSWALWIAQAVHEEKARLAGLTVEGRIRDRVPTPPLSTRDTIHALYVDNYMVCGHDPNTVQQEALGGEWSSYP